MKQKIALAVTLICILCSPMFYQNCSKVDFARDESETVNYAPPPPCVGTDCCPIIPSLCQCDPSDPTCSQVRLKDMAMITSDLKCVFCHTDIKGPVMNVRPPRESGPWTLTGSTHSVGSVYGDIKIGGIMRSDRWASTLPPYLPPFMSFYSYETSTHPNYPWNSTFKKSYRENHVINYMFDNQAGVDYTAMDSSRFQIVENSPDAINKGYPDFNETVIQSVATGTVKVGTQVVVTHVYNGNLVLNGRDVGDIDINGQVLVKGDLVILGRFKGLGTIYVTGNIWIPDNITNDQVNALFLQYEAAYNKPTRAQIETDAKAIATASLTKPGLYLAAKGAVFLGWNAITDDPTVGRTDAAKITNYNSTLPFAVGEGARSRRAMIDAFMVNPANPDSVTNSSSRKRVISWLGQQSFNRLLKAEYQTTADLPKWNAAGSCTSQKRKYVLPYGDVSRVDVSIYSQEAVVGVISGGNYLINGAVMAPKISLLNGSIWAGSMVVTQNIVDAQQNVTPTKGYNRNVFLADSRNQYIIQMAIQCVKNGAGSGFVNSIVRTDISSQFDYVVVDTTNTYTDSGLPISRSEIRYDWRLSVGGQGFNVFR